MKASKLTPSLSLGLGCLLLTLLPTLRSLSRAPQCPKSVGLAEEKGCTRTQPLRLLRQRLQGDQPELEDGAVRLVHNLSFPGPHILHVYQRAASELMQQAGSSWVSLQAKERFCGCLSRRPNAQVALVGNGPKSSQQLQAISQADCIIRFNRIDSRSQGDRTDIWIVRGTTGDNATLPWMFPTTTANSSEILTGEVRKLAKNVQGIVLANWFEFEFKKLKDSREAQAARVSRQQHGSSSSSGGGGGRGGSAQHAGSVAPWTPLVAKAAKLAGYDQRQAAAKLLPFELDGLLHIFGCKLSRALGFDVPYRKNTPCGWSTPSTGLIGLLAALECLPPSGRIHIFGFNWSDQNWDGHFIELERGFVQILAEVFPGCIVVHPAPCAAFRTCG